MKTERLNYYRRLAHAGNANAQRVVDAFDWNPDQPRDPDGKFGSGAGGSGGSSRSSTMSERYSTAGSMAAFHQGEMRIHLGKMEKLEREGKGDTAEHAAHCEAAAFHAQARSVHLAKTGSKGQREALSNRAISASGNAMGFA